MADDFILYILMRKDMESLNHTGKLIAQGAHAANHAAESIGAAEFGIDAMQQFSAWQKQTIQGFGTTIVLGGISGSGALKIADIQRLVENAKTLGVPAGVITDPGYPLSDGDTTHTFPCETCGWIFGSKAKLSALMSRYTLHQSYPGRSDNGECH